MSVPKLGQQVMGPVGTVIVTDPSQTVAKPGVNEADLALLRDYTGYVSAMVPELRGVPIHRLVDVLNKFLRTR